MRTKLLRGYFDVKEYKANKPREAWPLKAEGDTITFSVIKKAEELTEEEGEFAKIFANKNGENCARVSYKLSARTAWVNELGQAVAKPHNEALADGAWECIIEYRTLHGAEGSKEARGHWANAIQFRKAVVAAFAPMEGAAESIAKAAKPMQTEAPTQPMAVDQDLPF